MFPQLTKRLRFVVCLGTSVRLGLWCLVTSAMLVSLPASSPSQIRVDQEEPLVNQWVTRLARLRVKTRLTQKDVQISVAGPDGSSLNLSTERIRGTISIQCGSDQKWYRHELRTTPEGYLITSLPLLAASGDSVELRVQIIGVLEDQALLSYRVSGVVAAGGKQIQREAVARQRFCPISGHLLHLFSDPIEVNLSGRIVYCCSPECASQLEEATEEKLVSFPTVGTGEALEGDTDLIRLQKSCPVMDMPLGSMGDPVKVMVGRQPVFLCCKGCLGRVKKNPVYYAKQSVVGGSDEFLHRIAIASQAERFDVGDAVEKLPDGVHRVKEEDRQLIAAQKICPVMEEPLDAMGGPYKVNLNGKKIYICCPGCANSLRREPEEYVGFLHERGITLPLYR
ncbi:MAG: hypothetical protein L7U72_03000 [Rubripirellula sp.]|nr:hypothetical protein [Rubripirellula sp.]